MHMYIYTQNVHVYVMKTLLESLGMKLIHVRFKEEVIAKDIDTHSHIHTHKTHTTIPYSLQYVHVYTQVDTLYYDYNIICTCTTYIQCTMYMYIHLAQQLAWFF